MNVEPVYEGICGNRLERMGNRGCRTHAPPLSEELFKKKERKQYGR
jgi:hypothetical protein